VRLLILHVDYFNCSVTERGRSKIIEDPPQKNIEVAEALLALVSVEKQDETNPRNVSKKAIEELAEISQHLKVNTIVLHPFAHLFGKLSKPEVAVKTIKLIEEGLAQHGLKVTRTPFGWFNIIELRAKGHPLSRIARKISAHAQAD